MLPVEKSSPICFSLLDAPFIDVDDYVWDEIDYITGRIACNHTARHVKISDVNLVHHFHHIVELICPTTLLHLTNFTFKPISVAKMKQPYITVHRGVPPISTHLQTMPNAATGIVQASGRADGCHVRLEGNEWVIKPITFFLLPQ